MDSKSGNFRFSEGKKLEYDSNLRNEASQVIPVVDSDNRQAIIVYQKDKNSGILSIYSINNVAEEMFCLDKDITDKDILQIFPDYNTNGILTILNKLFAENVTNQITFITTRINNEYLVYLHNTFSKLTNDTIVHVIENFEAKKGVEKELFDHASLMMNNPNPVFSSDLEGKIVLYNPSAVKLYGKELMGVSVFEAIPSLSPEDYSAIKENGRHFTETKISNESYLFTILRNSKSGLYYIYATNVTQLHETQKIQQVLFEITTASHTTENLKELYKKIQNIVGTIIDTRNFFIALYDKVSDTISLPYFVDEMDSFSKIPAGRTLTSYVIKNDTSLLLTDKDILKMVKDGDIDLVGTLCKKWLGVPLKADDEVIGAIITQNYEDEKAIDKRHLKIMKFISDEIATAIEIKKAGDSLRTSEELFKSLIEQTSDAIFVLQDKKIVLVNPAWVSLFGYSYEEATSGNFSFDDLIIPEHRAVFNRTRSLQRKMKTGKIDYDLIITTKHGQKIDVEIYLSQITYRGYEAYQGVCRDITKRKKDIEKINKYNEELKILNANKDKFFSLIAHDLKSPFNALLGYSDFILSEFSNLTLEEIREGNQHINKSARNIYMLLENLLQWSGLQTGGISYQPKNFLLYNLGKKVVELYQKNAESKSIQLELNFDKFAEIYADENMIYTVLRNLVSNAIKFTRPGGEITLSSKITPEQTQFSVSDNGLGISEEDYEKLFRLDLSYSTRGTNNEKGTGLGLLLCRELIEKNNGTLIVDSTKGFGSTFTISLPSSDII